MRPRGELSPEEERLLGYNRPSKEDEEQAVKDRQRELEFRNEAILGLMRMQWFREWVWERLTALGTFINPYAVSPTGMPDPRATDFYTGRRSAGWDLWTELDDIAPDETALMRREAKAPKT